MAEFASYLVIGWVFRIGKLDQPLAKESIMKTLALIVLPMVVVLVPSWVSISDGSNITAIRQPHQPQKPYRGGSRRELKLPWNTVEKTIHTTLG